MNCPVCGTEMRRMYPRDAAPGAMWWFCPEPCNYYDWQREAAS